MTGDELMVVDPSYLDNYNFGVTPMSGSNATTNLGVRREFSENYGNPKNNKYVLTDTPGQTIRLTTVDGQVLFEGSGPDAVNKAADIVDAMNKQYGQGATWKLQTKPEGAADFTTVSQDTVAKKKKTALNSFLDVALPLAGGLLVPGLGLMSGALGAAAGAGGASLVNSALQNQSIEDALKTAALNAAGAGVGNYVGGQLQGMLPTGTSNAVTEAMKAEGQLIMNNAALQSGLSGLGSAAGSVSPVIINAATQGLGTALGTGLGAATGGALAGGGGTAPTVDELVVTANTNQPVTPTPGVGGGTGGTTVVDPITVTPNQPNTETPTAPVTPPTGNVVDPVTVQPKPGTVLQDLGAGAGTIIAGAGGTILWQPPTLPPPVDELVVTPPKPSVTPGTVVGGTAGTVAGSTSGGTNDKLDWKDVLPVIGGLVGGASGGSSGTNYTSPKWAEGTAPGQEDSLGSIFRGTLPTSNLNLAARNMADRDWNKYGFGPEASFFQAVPERNFARGGFAVKGPGGGRDDLIKANLSDGEYVIDAETVALLGDGSAAEGAKKLDAFRVNVRKDKGKDLAKGAFSVKAKKPAHYMKGRR